MSAEPRREDQVTQQQGAPHGGGVVALLGLVQQRKVSAGCLLCRRATSCTGFDVCLGTVFFCRKAPCRAGCRGVCVCRHWALGQGKMGKRKDDVVVVVGLLSSAACVLVYLWEACMGGDGVLAVLCWLSTAVRG